MVSSIEREEDRKLWWSIHDKEKYVCPDCGKTREEHGRRWEVHHIDGEAGKCVALCATCHKVRHGATRESIDLEAWKEGFLNL